MDAWLIGVLTALQPSNLLFIFLGVTIGIIVGALPGLNAAVGVSLMVPFTYYMDPSGALLMLVGLYGGALYGGSITAILIRTPGTPASAATLLDGYELHKKGLSGTALGISAISSSFGWVFSTVVLILLAGPLVKVALAFSAVEYFALGIFGLSMVASLSGKNLLKGITAAVLGLIITTVGTDPFSGMPRFTFGFVELTEGIDFIIAMIGLFAVSEVLVQAAEIATGKAQIESFSTKPPAWRDIRALIPTILRSAIIGTFVGVVPGAGGSVAGFIAYNEAKRASRHPEGFGHGSPEGVAAPEAANNATEGGALVPMLTLGVPGSPTTAVLLGALMLHGLRPGPALFQQRADIVYALYVGLIIGALILLLLGLTAVRLFIRAVNAPKPALLTVILTLSLIGSYSVGNDMFSVWVMIIFSLLGYMMRRYEFPAAPMVLGIVLGFMVESSLRRALIISHGSWLIFFTRPISLIILTMAGVSIVVQLLREYSGRWRMTKPFKFTS